MASRKLYASPVLKDDEDSENWLRGCHVAMRYRFRKKKRGPAIYLSLEGKARQCYADFEVQIFLNKTNFGTCYNRKIDIQ